jgi:hypothetical protein
MASEVECGSGGRRYGKLARPPELVFGDCLIACDDTAWRVPAVVDQLDPRINGDESSAVQRRRRGTGDDSTPPGPQPRCDGSVTQRQHAAAGRMNIRMNGPVPTRELMSRDDAGGYGLTADDDLPHAQIIATATDNSRNVIPADKVRVRPCWNDVSRSVARRRFPRGRPRFEWGKPAM